MGAKFAVAELRSRSAVFEGSVHPVTQNLVEPLGSRGQVAEVVVIEGPGLGPVDDLHENVVEHEVNPVGLSAVGELLAGEDDAVTSESGLKLPLPAVRERVSEFRVDARKSVLEKG